jgi:RNA polymerase primary sigma factor
MATHEPPDPPEFLERFLTRLEEVPRRVVTLRFGLDSESPRTHEEVADLVGLAPESVKAIEREAMAKLAALGEADA